MKIHCMPLLIKSSWAELLNKVSFSINQFFSGLCTFRHSPIFFTVGPSKEESTPINTMYILCKASLSGKGTSFEKCQRFNIMLDIPAHTSSVQILFHPHKQHLMRVLRNPKRIFYSAPHFRPMVDLRLPEAFIAAGANSWLFLLQSDGKWSQFIHSLGCLRPSFYDKVTGKSLLYTFLVFWFSWNKIQ